MFIYDRFQSIKSAASHLIVLLFPWMVSFLWKFKQYAHKIGYNTFKGY